jgi:hypothetical protein
MRIFLKTFDKKMLSIIVEPSATISSLRNTELKDFLKESKLMFKG